MCGIAGWFGNAFRPDSHHAVIDGMLNRIAYRGPDGRGVAHLPKDSGVLGHVRLATIDPSGGQQPLWSSDGHSVIVFNGAIYNYCELRADLAGRGIRLHTHSDTEVLLEILLRDGVAGLQRLRGMFALALWDGHRGRGLLARDPLGIKPLFVRADGHQLWFASEAKAFPRTTEWKPQLDCARLHLLLNFRYPAGGHGLMQNVAQLAPGECIEWSPDGARSQQTDLSTPAPQSALHVRDEVFDSVRAHLVADVPVSCYLSGGLDSGTVAYSATKISDGTIGSYTIDAGDDPAELRNARATARWLGIENVAGALVPTTTAALDWLLWHLEVPKINALQSAAVAQLAAGGAKVCLSGLGGDELFLGYRAHALMARWSRVTGALGPLASPIGHLASQLLAGGIRFGEPWRAASMLAHAGTAAHAYGLLRNVWDGSLPREEIYGPRMLDQPLPDAHDWIAERWPDSLHPVHAMAEFEWRNKMVDDLLWQEDRVSMGFGLEVRLPFVDIALKSSLEQLRCEQMGRPGRKDRLRNAFADELPVDVLKRPKSGFQIDIAAHLDAVFGPALSQWLSPERVRHHGLFAPAYVDRLLTLRRHRSHRWHFFMLLLMALSHRWIELFEQGEPPPTVPPALSRVLP